MRLNFDQHPFCGHGLSGRAHFILLSNLLVDKQTVDRPQDRIDVELPLKRLRAIE
jgi:hypothetical protein